MAPRRLVLIRHAQAGNAPLDADRPLTEHGRHQALAIGAWLAQSGLEPDRVLVSSARRAVLTWAEAGEQLPSAVRPTVDPRLYENTFESVLAAIRETPDPVRTLAVVGHNPSVAALASELDDGDGPVAPRDSLADGFPAGGAAVFDLPATFAALTPGTATLVGVHLPGR